MDPIQTLRAELDKLLAGGSAHAGLEEAVKDFPAELYGAKLKDVPHSAWELLEHMRIAQRDMLEFSRNPSHRSPEWPRGYWPESAAPRDGSGWDDSIRAFRKDLEALRKLVADPASDLFTPFVHGEGQTLLREALQVADHNAYHIGELIFLRRILGAWKAI
jgi:hypothetical protein